MKRLAVLAVVAVLTASCQTHHQAAPRTSATVASSVSQHPSSAPVTSQTLRGATVTLSANYPTVGDAFTNTVTGPVNLSFTADSISVNDAGRYVTDGAKQILDVMFSTL